VQGIVFRVVDDAGYPLCRPRMLARNRSKFDVFFGLLA
jgi:hypothetical protein